MRTETKRFVALAVGFAACLLAPATQAQAIPPAHPGASPLGAARPITAWVSFCQSNPADCGFGAGEPDRITLTPALWSTIVAVNRRVNQSIRAVTDQDHLGIPDRWDFAEDGIGDCEDFQLVKRRELARAGLSRKAMRMTVVIDEQGEGHAVLAVITDRGDFILDNKISAVLPWHRTGYTFIKRESQDGHGWVSLGGVTGPLVTATR